MNCALPCRIIWSMPTPLPPWARAPSRPEPSSFPKPARPSPRTKKRMLSREATFDNNVMGLVPDTRRLLPEYLLYWLLSFDLSTWASGARPPSMRKRTVEEHLLPVPELSVQRRVVKEIEAERRLVEANRALIVRFEAKASQALARIWAESE